MDKKAIMQEFVDFVEGRTSFDEFRRNYETSPDYKKLLDDKKPGSKYRCLLNTTINDHMHLYNWTTTMGKAVVHADIVRYLEYYGILFSATKIYDEALRYQVDIQPNYVSMEDNEFLETIIATAPEGLTATQKKKWLKERITSLFKYDVKPPRWIQDPEWPIVDGKPLVFKRQTKVLKNDERVWYTFYDSETGKETVIMQSY